MPRQPPRRCLLSSAFDPGPKPGTFQSCSTTNRIDYIFVSKNLAPKVVSGGIERHGLWGAPSNKNPPSLGNLSRHHAAQPGGLDHAAVFVDINHLTHNGTAILRRYRRGYDPHQSLAFPRVHSAATSWVPTQEVGARAAWPHAPEADPPVSVTA